MMKKIIVHVLPWFFISCGAVYLINDAIQASRTADEWMTVRRVLVQDATHGKPPVMFVEREIRQPFTATWSVIARKVVEGRLEIVCTASGGGLYRVGAELPEVLTLDWWTFPVKCDLPPGRHIVDTVWRIQVAPDRVKIVTASSNIFTVLP
jgi:hypothetical protein